MDNKMTVSAIKVAARNYLDQTSGWGEINAENVENAKKLLDEIRGLDDTIKKYEPSNLVETEGVRKAGVYVTNAIGYLAKPIFIFEESVKAAAKKVADTAKRQAAASSERKLVSEASVKVDDARTALQSAKTQKEKDEANAALAKAIVDRRIALEAKPKKRAPLVKLGAGR